MNTNIAFAVAALPVAALLIVAHFSELRHTHCVARYAVGTGAVMGGVLLYALLMRQECIHVAVFPAMLAVGGVATLLGHWISALREADALRKRLTDDALKQLE